MLIMKTLNLLEVNGNNSTIMIKLQDICTEHFQELE